MYEFLQYQIHDVMTVDPIAISPKAKLREAEELFETHDFNGVLGQPTLPARHADQVRLAECVLFRRFTPGPLRRHHGTNRRNGDDREPVTVAPQLPLSRLLQNPEIRAKSLPVVEEGHRLVGIISARMF